MPPSLLPSSSQPRSAFWNPVWLHPTVYHRKGPHYPYYHLQMWWSGATCKYPRIFKASLGLAIVSWASLWGPQVVDQNTTLLVPGSPIGQRSWEAQTRRKLVKTSGIALGRADSVSIPTGCSEESCGSFWGLLSLLQPRDRGKLLGQHAAPSSYPCQLPRLRLGNLGQKDSLYVLASLLPHSMGLLK